MDQETIIIRLLDIKKQVTSLGIDCLQSNTPISLSDSQIVLKPFSDIEVAIEKSIKKINSKPLKN